MGNWEKIFSVEKLLGKKMSWGKYYSGKNFMEKKSDGKKCHREKIACFTDKLRQTYGLDPSFKYYQRIRDRKDACN